MTIAMTLLAAFLSGLINTLYRKSYHWQADGWSLMLACSLLGGIALLFIVPFPNFSILTSEAVLLILLSCSLWTLMILFDFYAYEDLAVTTNAIFGAFGYILIAVSGFLFFGEDFSFSKALGVFLIALAIAVTTASGRFIFNRGAVLRLLTAFCQAIALSLDKYVLSISDFSFVLLAGYLVPGVILLLLRPKSVLTIPAQIRRSKGEFLLIVLLFTTIGSTVIYLINEGAMSIVMSVFQLKIIFAWLLAWWLLKENDAKLKNGISSLLATIGAIFMVA